MLVLLICLLAFSGGVLSGRRPPKHKEPLCPKNEHYVRKDTSCPKTCGNRLLPGETVEDCDPFTGCVCDSGYLRRYDNGTGPCIPKKKCAPIPKKCGKNETPTSCKTDCPPQSCENMYLASDCEPGDCEPGCDCIDDYLRNEKGDCVPIDDCFLPCDNSSENDNSIPWYTLFTSRSESHASASASASSSSYSNGTSSSYSSSSSSSSTSSSYSSTSMHSGSGCGKKCKDKNAIYKKCPNPCPLTCAEPNPRPCSKMCLQYGCECKPGFILTKIGGKCVLPDDCPEPLCPKHEHYVMNDPNGIRTCGNRLIPGDNTEECESYTGCVCDRCYVRKYDNGTGPCIPKKQCPPIPKKCGINEERTSCKINCPPQTCESTYSSYFCLPNDCEPGCNCIDGYLRNSTGVCIPSETCPGPPLVCGENEVPSNCKIVCPPQSCESIYTLYSCANGPCTPGCNCKDGYLRNSLDICIPSDECFSESNPCDDPNASPQECASTCQPTCDDPDISNRVCTLSCRLGGCVCNPGYILDKPGGKCIKKEDCPKQQICSDPNASPQNCPSYCQPTCDQPDTSGLICPAACLPSGCVCNSGYILDRAGGTCIKIEDCPGNQCSDPNASPSTEECTSPCQPTCEHPDTRDIICIMSCQIGACVCNPGYILDKAGGTCIKIEDCPAPQKCSDPNASPKDCPSYCQPTCDQPDTSVIDCVDACLPSGCVCNPGYILDEAGGTCIKIEDCPGTQQCSDPNASSMPCPSYCQPTCGQPNNVDILCVDACLPSGCVCNPGYILEKDGGMCIKVEDCPEPQQCRDPNASLMECPSYCQPTCEQPDTTNIVCPAACLPSGCVCNPGYILDKDGGECILIEDCPDNQQCSDPNASPLPCPSYCQPTCDQPDIRGMLCVDACLPGGCVCNPGYILDTTGGTCIRREDCPGNQQCSDPNASPSTGECTSPCQPTCEQPDTSDIICILSCQIGACVCNPGYILDKAGGTCIKIEDCPGGEPECGANKTYVYCSVGCPDRYCPYDDSRGIIACDPPNPCPSGCDCEPGYLMLSFENSQCVLSSDCPPVTCTRPNEVWDPSPSNCNLESCDDIGRECSDSSSGPPRCVCESGYYRNSSDICVPASECDNQGCDGDRNATSVICPNPNPPTCTEPGRNSGIEVTDLEIVPDFTCMSIGCQCKPGFVLSERGGQCIDPRDCPDDQSCNGDNNATIRECPNVCPATCADADTRNRPCPAICLGLGCECKPGFILSAANGPCIDPYDCPGGKPECGANKTYVYCYAGCPDSYCPTDDSRDIIACDPPYPCSSGCDCEPGYLMLSYENSQCVLSSDCPPVTCTRPNEVWDPSPSNCNLESCDDIGRECDDFSTSPPRCVCESGYYRNSSDICVPASECDNPGCGGDPNAISVICPNPNPPTCTEPGSNSGIEVANPEIDPEFTCMSIGCECKPGFVLSERGGRCIYPSDCPEYQSCNGDNNATIRECPNPCPATCADPDTRNRPCIDICLGLGCDCKTGFILSEDGGECISPADCPGGIPECGENKTYVDCFVGCPPSYCPTSDSRGIIACSVAYPCPPGCACKPGYLMLSYSDTRCVLSSECPPVTCTRPNEVWDPSPSNCYFETCEDMDRVCDHISGEPPRCVCKSGYYRNASDICVPASECVKECNGDPNAKYSTCPSHCPTTCENSGKGIMCIASCARPGCVCKDGYILSEQTGKCVKPEECPIECDGDPNAVYSGCPSYCPRTCDSDENQACIAACAPPGCVCKPGYIISDETGLCVKPEECPPKGCDGDPNAEYSDCPSYCPRTCSSDDDQVCIAACAPPGCVCKPGYIISDETGLCIKPEECPPKGCKGDPNAVYSGCPTYCPLTCDLPDRSGMACVAACAPPGCVCKSGYLQSKNGCVKPDGCPGGSPNCGANKTYVSCKFGCPTNYCPTTDSRAMVACSPPYPCNGGCACNSGYLFLDDLDAKCVLSSDCPPVKCTRQNEVWDPSPSNCYLERCEDMNTKCDNNYPSPPRCVCKPGYYRNQNDICIPASECHPSYPRCGINEIARDCRRICPPQTCESRYTLYSCDQYMGCEPGCDCVPNYLRNSDGICIPSDKCSLPFGKCPIPKKCIRTCASPNPPNCPYTPAKTNRDGCECMEGYILSELGGTCIRIEDCPIEQGCNGDLHARTKQCPLPCPSTCDSPNATPCKRMCDPIGCECELGYIFCEENGKCILPDNCPGGNPCGVNEEFRQCRTNCPDDYCPVDDSRDIAVCDYICLSGCACKLNHRRLSREDDTCVVSSDCPPVNCTRQNEVWDGCPLDCFSGYCEDKEYQDTECNTLLLNCQPKCVCERDYFRNGSDICVPESECPPTCSVPDECLRTCDSPNPPNCPYEPSDTNIDGCNCMEGYILSEIGGECIRIEECPSDGSCNGDPNARPKRCPIPCPSTCKSPEAFPCKKRCEPIGCECKPGYILSKINGLCIKPNKCPGGNPCGPNANFVSCKNGCPTDYCPVDDSRARPICEPTPAEYCLSGCKCKLNHKWLSREDKTCIVASDCPPVNCTRPNEVWDGCPSACLAERCEDRNNQPKTCQTLVQNCQPACICRKKFFRNETDICVPPCDC